MVVLLLGLVLVVLVFLAMVVIGLVGVGSRLNAMRSLIYAVHLQQQHQYIRNDFLVSLFRAILGDIHQLCAWW